MQISITGPRGCGKTTVAAEIARFLRDRGMDVRLVADGIAATSFLYETMHETPVVNRMTKRISITILDSFDKADELSIKLAKNVEYQR